MADAAPLDREFNIKRVSPSRIGAYADCGEKFRLKYIEHVPVETMGSAALFGKVVHRARETWVLDRSKNLIELMERAWPEELRDEPTLSAFITEYQAISRKACRLEEEIRRARPEIRAPRMTKDWKQSSVAKDTNRLLAKWLDRLNKESRYKFSERDPLPALYDESLILAWKYSDKYRHLPPAFYTEFGFEMEWEGFTFNGFIDDISPLIDKDTGEMTAIGVVDAKTYRYPPDHDFKDGRQLGIYRLAVQEYVKRGVLDLDLEKYPLYCGVDLMRLLEMRWFHLDETDDAHLLRELQMYERGVENEVFIPASKSCKADFCDFAGQCAFYHGNKSKVLEVNFA